MVNFSSFDISEVPNYLLSSSDRHIKRKKPSNSAVLLGFIFPSEIALFKNKYVTDYLSVPNHVWGQRV